jgi:methylthioribose-1-phosphate isomerase
VEEIRAVQWDPASSVIALLDQTRLPGETVDFICDDVERLIDAIQRLVVRGAPALGAVGALGVALAMVEGGQKGWSDDVLQEHVDAIRNARPTAVNLAWGVDRVRPRMSQGVEAVLAEAAVLIEDDEAANHALSTLGADWIMQTVDRRPLRVLTHSNTGSLATTGWGTALGIIRELHSRGVLELVYADETRPLLQGARLTAWELQHDGIPYLVQPDGAAASTMLRGLVDVAIIGADRIARNGDTANKIGSLGVALGCQAAGIPFVVAAPSSTVDLLTLTGADIEIELRPEEEVTTFAGVLVAPPEARGYNPAFDVTPARYISAIATEYGVLEPDGVSPVTELTGTTALVEASK